MNLGIKVMIGINIILAVAIISGSLFYAQSYFYDEPIKVRARADELCLDHFNNPSSIITRSLVKPDEWHFLCGGRIIPYMLPISESALLTGRKDGGEIIWVG